MVNDGGRRMADGGNAMRARRFTPLVLLACLIVIWASPVAAQAGRAAMDEGVKFMNANQSEKAERKFEEAVKADPSNGLYHLWLGRAVGNQAQQASILRQPFLAKRVKAEFERAVELDPDLLDARDGLIDFYLQAPGFMGGSVEKANEQQREIAKRDPMRGLGAAVNIAWHGKDTVATEKALRAVIAAQPDSVLPVIRLGQFQQLWGRTDAAFATFNGFAAKHPTDVGIRFQTGRLAAISGQQLPHGERLLRDLLAGPGWEPSPSRPSKQAVHFRLGMVLEKSGRKEDARAAYQRALSIDPEFQLAKDALKALK